MKVLRSLFIFAALSITLMAIPAVAAAQTIDLNVYLLSRTIHFVKGQAVAIDFCNVDRTARDIKMYFVDENGNTLKSAATHVMPGQTVSLNFTFGELPRGSSGRIGVRGAIVVANPPEPDSDPPGENLALGNIEVYDTQTGRTGFGLLLPAVRNPNMLFPTDQ